jgi:hypothetical protein
LVSRFSPSSGPIDTSRRASDRAHCRSATVRLARQNLRDISSGKRRTYRRNVDVHSSQMPPRWYRDAAHLLQGRLCCSRSIPGRRFVFPERRCRWARRSANDRQSQVQAHGIPPAGAGTGSIRSCQEAPQLRQRMQTLCLGKVNAVLLLLGERAQGWTQYSIRLLQWPERKGALQTAMQAECERRPRG